jgi:hypothetical protein
MHGEVRAGAEPRITSWRRPLIIGKLLGHTQPVTPQRYAHLAADPMREAAEKIGATLNAALSGN